MNHFSRSEFACKHCGEVHISPRLEEMADIAREVAGVPFIINSGYRCPGHNKAVGGREDSAHVRGYAMDIATPDSFTRFRVLMGAVLADFRRIGIYPTFIHMDCDPEKPEDVAWFHS